MGLRYHLVRFVFASLTYKSTDSVGEASRLDLEEMLGCRVHLFLFVKVREKWGDDPDRYRDWGLDFDA